MSEENMSNEVKLGEKPDLKGDFTPPDYEQWKQVVEKDLKGADFGKKLITKTYEGISLQPIYTRKDTENLQYVNNVPGMDGLRRGLSASGYLGKSWEICQEIISGDSEEFNSALKNDLKRGQTAINVQLDSATKLGKDADYSTPDEVGDSGLSISAIKSITRAFEGIDLKEYPFFVKAGFSALPFISVFAAFLKKNDLSVSEIEGSIESDPINYLAEKGKLPVSMESALDEMSLATKWVIKNQSQLKTIGVDASIFNNAGASAVQELAFAMSTAVFYIEEMIKRGISAEEAAGKIRFTFGISTNYFMEISKFRAARILWSNILENYGIEADKREMTIHAKSSLYYQTKLDPYVNMLRTTTEAFSAVVGGVSSIHTNPFDESFSIADNFSRRIARNTQIILKEESHLDSLIDPAGGSYYVEKLTDDIAVESWKLIGDIEEKGNIFDALESGFIKESIDSVVSLRNKDYSKRKSVLVGTNMYPNITEEKAAERKADKEKFFKKRSDYLQKFRVSGDQKKNAAILEKLQSLVNDHSVESIDTASSAILEGATIGEISSAVRASAGDGILITPLTLKRAGEMFEELREASDKYLAEKGNRPQIFMANMGPLKQFKARADFSKGFFEVAGFEMIYTKGFATAADAVKAANESGAPAVIICSTDDAYPEFVPEIAKGVKENNSDTQIILAGYPKEQIEAHKASGVDEFIFLGADAYQILSGLMKKIGAM